MKINILYTHRQYICYQVEYKHRALKQVEIYPNFETGYILKVSSRILEHEPLFEIVDNAKRYKIQKR